MSQRLISLSADLVRLRDDGYDVETIADFLVLKHVPYVTPSREVAYGTLVSRLELSGDVTVRPSDHVAFFAGETPCDADGQPLSKIINSSGHQVLAEGVEIDHTFSSKPDGGYVDYHQKMTTYVSLVSRFARQLEPQATATTFPVYDDDDEDPRFAYSDTASTRAQISVFSDRLRDYRIAIVGLGGTGAYVLDLVVKTPVREIHLYDGDRFVQHNAFRAPGAPGREQLVGVPQKVEYWAQQYSRMKRDVVPHDCYIDEENVELLRDMSFVFVAVDDGAARRLIVESLEEYGVAFIDTGMGVYEGEDALAAVLRVTTSSPTYRAAKSRMPFVTAAPDDYDRNIQVADLNALNGALAVIKWKKLAGFYADLGREHQTLYTVSDNEIVNEEQA
ncbi:MAG TPA: ThiF family adenylyltransferase [Solirubrobacteraceae bacterium]|jgi:hypothetical protein|nr:ThiF family adenylyltransferase [Solirubrobacteraceae bacterium]